MFYLDINTINAEKYYNRIKTLVDNKIKKIRTENKSLIDQINNLFTKDDIKRIIISLPKELIDINKDKLDFLDTYNYHGDFYGRYKAFEKREVISGIILEIFDYDSIISDNKSVSYELAKLLDINTCVYCNRQYTFTVGECKNDETRIIRPDFDHWFAKSDYPLLALSFYNLIPSCAICNRSLKHDKKFELGTHVHPYLKEDGDGSFTFSYEPNSTDSYNVRIKEKEGRMINNLEVFKIEEIYDAHSAYELQDMIDLNQKYSKNYINQLFNDMFKLSISEKEVYRLVFGIEYDEKDFHKRPFSKFKHDIIKELRETKGN